MFSKSVKEYIFGEKTFDKLGDALADRRCCDEGYVVFFLDKYFENSELLKRLPAEEGDRTIFVDTSEEPKTDGVNALRDMLVSEGNENPPAIVGIGGGATLDTSKAVSNLLANGGTAEDYQGWDLVKVPGVFKVGVPTLSGTGSETSRTCVMTNKKSGLKLGMNSEYTMFDRLVLDPDLTRTVPADQYFYTGADTYIHCIECLGGIYRHHIGDAYSEQAIKMCREVFSSDDMMSDEARSKLMVASYLGGYSIANGIVGLIHPFSAGLSVVLNTHHGIGNCITMNAMEEFYPAEYDEFFGFAQKQGINIPQGICKGLSDEKFEELYNATIIHEKPLKNALGEDFKNILTPEKVKDIFLRM